MSKDGDNDLFSEMEFIIPGAEIEQTGNTDAEEATASSSVEEQTTTTQNDQSNEIDLNFDNPSGTDESNGDTSSSVEDTNTGASSSSPLSSSLVTALSAEGFFSVDDEELKNLEGSENAEEAIAEFIRKKLNSEIDNKVKSTLTEKQKEALDAFEKGVPMQEFVNSNARQESYQKITNDFIQSNPNAQAELVRRAAIAKGLSAEDAADYVNTLKQAGEEKLIEKAIAGRDTLIQAEIAHRNAMQEEAQAEVAREEELRTERLKKTKEYINSHSEIIEGLPLTDTLKENLYKKMTTPVGKDSNGQPINAIGLTRSENPEKFNMLLAYYHELGLFNETPDLSALRKVAENKTAKGLSNLLKEGTSFLQNSGSKTSNSATGDSDLGLDFI